MAMFDFTPKEGFVRFSDGKNMQQFGTDMLIGSFNKWHSNNMEAAGVEISVANFFNRLNGNLRNTVWTGMKEEVKDE